MRRSVTHRDRLGRFPMAAACAWILLCLLAASLCGVVPPPDPASSTSKGGAPPADPLAPRSSADDALVGQLHTATLITRDLDAIRAFYVDGLGLTLEGPLPVADETRAMQRRLWGLGTNSGLPPGRTPLGWDLYRLHRPAVADTVRVRLLVPDRETPRIHSTWNAREPGPFSLGFPAQELVPWDRALRAAGFESMNPMSDYRVPRADGTSYGMHEAIWKAPDFMHTVTLSRRDGMPQLGPTDRETGRGGPVYSAQVIGDSDRVLAFYTDVLGMEMRSDREWKSHGSTGALAVPDGTVFRFSILYAPGASHGHLLFVDFRERTLPATGVPPRPPNRGLAMWSFPTRDLDEVRRRAEAHGAEVIYGPVNYRSPMLGRHRAMTVLAPNGFLIELFEPVTASNGGDSP